MSEQRMVVTTRDCPARLVPVGDPVTIPAHNFVTITQSLGGNYTVVYQGNMLRVDGTDADALGLAAPQLPARRAGIITQFLAGLAYPFLGCPADPSAAVEDA